MNIIQREIKKRQWINRNILFVQGDGCQGYHSFQWLGKIIGFKKGGDNIDNVTVAEIQMTIVNGGYGDIRDGKYHATSFEQENKTWPMEDIQEVDNLLVIYN
jgi:hypothetical protein